MSNAAHMSEVHEVKGELVSLPRVRHLQSLALIDKSLTVLILINKQQYLPSELHTCNIMLLLLIIHVKGPIIFSPEKKAVPSYYWC